VGVEAVEDMAVGVTGQNQNPLASTESTIATTVYVRWGWIAGGPVSPVPPVQTEFRIRVKKE